MGDRIESTGGKAGEAKGIQWLMREYNMTEEEVRMFLLNRQARPTHVTQEDVKQAQSTRTVQSFVSAGLEAAKYGNMTPATTGMFQRDAAKSDPYGGFMGKGGKPGEQGWGQGKPQSTPAQGMSRIDNPNTSSIPSVPNGPYGWNYEEKGEPQLIPNADEKVFTENNAPGYPVPRFVPRPALVPSGPPVNRISLPDDPDLYKAYLEMISGGST